MNKLKICALLIISGFLFSIAGVASASGFSLPTFGNSPKVQPPATQNQPDATQMQTKLIQDFVVGQKSVLVAQSDIANALGNKDLAAKLTAEVSTLSAAPTQADLGRVMASSKGADEQNEKDMASEKKLTADAHANMGKAIPEYLLGVGELIRLRPDFQNFLKQATQELSSSPMTALTLKSKLAEGMYIADNAPGYTESLAQTASGFITYAKGNNISVPKNATALLSGLQ